MNRIKEVLKEKGIKQIWLADKLGKSYNMVNGYVQNRQQPRLEVLSDIAKVLNVDVRELIKPINTMSKKRDIDVSKEAGLIWQVANDVLQRYFSENGISRHHLPNGTDKTLRMRS